MKYKFVRSSRLCTQAEYRQVFHQAQHHSGTYWQVLAKDNKSTSPRLGLVISKRVLKRATERNTYKRIAKEVFRLNQYNLALLDFVVMAKKGYKTRAERKILHTELLELLKRF